MSSNLLSIAASGAAAAEAALNITGLLMNSSESIAVADGEMVLGSWHSILFVELDGPRERRGLDLQIMGEA